eukprot:657975-Pleurochrysis_carterae.AAC.1
MVVGLGPPIRLRYARDLARCFRVLCHTHITPFDIRCGGSVDRRSNTCGAAFESDRNACVGSRDKLLALAPRWRLQQVVGTACERGTDEVAEPKLPAAKREISL